MSELGRSRKKRHKIIRLPIQAYLSYLLLATFLLSGVTFSRYVTRTEGSDVARIATFGNVEIQESGSFNADGKLVIVPGIDLQKIATVIFEGSESATYMFVEIETGTSWKCDQDNKAFSVMIEDKELMTWSVADEWTYLEPVTDNRRVYYRALLPNQALKGNIIKENKITVSKDMTESELAGLADLYINFRATAVQSDGFESVSKAWLSLKTK